MPIVDKMWYDCLTYGVCGIGLLNAIITLVVSLVLTKSNFRTYNDMVKTRLADYLEKKNAEYSGKLEWAICENHYWLETRIGSKFKGHKEEKRINKSGNPN